jgi:hypothetical protein
MSTFKSVARLRKIGAVVLLNRHVLGRLEKSGMPISCDFRVIEVYASTTTKKLYAKTSRGVEENATSKIFEYLDPQKARKCN